MRLDRLLHHVAERVAPIAERARRIVDRVARLLTATDTSLAEFWGSTTLLTVGLWLLLPFPRNTFTTTPVYRLMSAVASEHLWGIVSLVLGALQSVANVTKRMDSRRAAAFATSVFFGFVASLAFVSLPESLLAPICGTASLVEGVVFLHLRGPIKEAPRVVT